MVLSLTCCVFVPLGYAVLYGATLERIVDVAGGVVGFALFFHVLLGIQRLLKVDDTGPDVDLE
jgi:hypothetical protein